MLTSVLKICTTAQKTPNASTHLVPTSVSVDLTSLSWSTENAWVSHIMAMSTLGTGAFEMLLLTFLSTTALKAFLDISLHLLKLEAT